MSFCFYDQYIRFADEDIMNSLHRFRPKFLVKSDGLPSYYEPYEFQHTCLLECEQNGYTNSLATEDELLGPFSETRKCVAAPFVDLNDFKMNEVAENMATVIKEVVNIFLILEPITLGIKIDLYICLLCKIDKNAVYRGQI